MSILIAALLIAMMLNMLNMSLFIYMQNWSSAKQDVGVFCARKCIPYYTTDDYDIDLMRKNQQKFTCSITFENHLHSSHRVGLVHSHWVTCYHAYTPSHAYKSLLPLGDQRLEMTSVL